MKTMWILGLSLIAVNAVAASKTESRLLKGKALDKAQLMQKCLPLQLGDLKNDCTVCKVSKVDDFGKVEGDDLAIASYEYFWGGKDAQKSCAFGTVLLKKSSDGKSFKPLWGGVGQLPTESDEKPKIIASDKGHFVQIPVRFSGTAHLEGDGVLFWPSGKNSKMREIETDSYQADIKSRLPGVLSIEKNMFPNYETMTVDSGVWTEDDANCCPSGGHIKASLDVSGNKLIVKTYSFDPQAGEAGAGSEK